MASLAFVALGLPDGLLGVAWPSIRRDFGLHLDALGGLLVSFTSGYVVSSAVGGRLVSQLGLARLLAASCLTTAASLVGYALVADWWVVVLFGVSAGAGAGGIDTGINTYAATHHGPRMLNWLHACYGVGAAMGPAIMTVVFAAHLSWRWGYVGVVVAQLALAAVFAGSRRAWPSDPRRLGETGDDVAPLYETLRLGRAQASMLLFLTYTGLELAIGIWAFTLLTEARGMAVMVAGSWSALYWVALTTGRLTRAAVGTRVEIRTVLRTAVAGLTLGLGLLALGASHFTDLVGLLLAGFAAGPIFPTLIAATPDRLGPRHIPNAVGLQIGSAAVGQATLPSALGVLGDDLGLQALSFALLVIALAVVAINEVAGGGATQSAPQTSAATDGQYSSSS